MPEPQSPQKEKLEKALAILRAHPYDGLAKHAETLRRFFIAVAGDLHVIMDIFDIRLAQLRESKITEAEAHETLDIYAPLANRLGMGRLKAEFETRSFSLVKPDEYKFVQTLLKKREPIANRNLEKIYRSFRKYLAKEGVPILSADYRLKNIYSLYKKLLRYDMDITKISDLLALRLVTDSVENCYKILGLIHNKWKPVPGKVKDYIANPKPNGYQSVHTTIYTGDGSTAEIQVRTRQMHEEAEWGVAAHVGYDESGKDDRARRLAPGLAWVKEMLELARRTKDAGEFAEAVNLDFFKNRIFVFTPKGDVIELPEGSTPIDFAYAVHSEIGNHARAVKIGGKYAGFDKALHGGETVDIETSKSAHPSAKWLALSHTTFARRKIRTFLAKSRLKY